MNSLFDFMFVYEENYALSNIYFFKIYAKEIKLSNRLQLKS